jgi:DNA-binding protein Fis
MTTIKKSISFDENQFKRLKKIQEDFGTPISNSVKRALEEYFKKIDKKK